MAFAVYNNGERHHRRYDSRKRRWRMGGVQQRRHNRRHHRRYDSRRRRARCAVYNNGGTIGDITGDLTAGNASACAVYNNGGTIGDITGDLTAGNA